MLALALLVGFLVINAFGFGQVKWDEASGSGNVLLAAISTLIKINRRSFAYLPIDTCIVLDTGSISLSLSVALSLSLSLTAHTKKI